MKKIYILQSGPKTNNQKYGKWVASLGAIPIIIPFLKKDSDSKIKELLADADGLLMPGGIDVHPMTYDENLTGSTNSVRAFDKWQLKYLKEAIANKIPVYGICRGMQLIAVHFECKLIQDIASNTDIKAVEIHRQGDKGFERGEISHMVIDGKGKKSEVNSFHHQAVGLSVKEFAKACPELCVTHASTPGGVVEAYKHRKLPIVGVQWHPEELNSKLSNDLFRDTFKIKEDVETYLTDIINIEDLMKQYKVAKPTKGKAKKKVAKKKKK